MLQIHPSPYWFISHEAAPSIKRSSAACQPRTVLCCAHLQLMSRVLDRKTSVQAGNVSLCNNNNHIIIQAPAQKTMSNFGNPSAQGGDGCVQGSLDRVSTSFELYRRFLALERPAPNAFNNVSFSHRLPNAFDQVDSRKTKAPYNYAAGAQSGERGHNTNSSTTKHQKRKKQHLVFILYEKNNPR